MRKGTRKVVRRWYLGCSIRGQNSCSQQAKAPAVGVLFCTLNVGTGLVTLAIPVIAAVPLCLFFGAVQDHTKKIFFHKILLARRLGQVESRRSGTNHLDNTITQLPQDAGV